MTVVGLTDGLSCGIAEHEEGLQAILIGADELGGSLLLQEGLQHGQADCPIRGRVQIGLLHLGLLIQ